MLSNDSSQEADSCWQRPYLPYSDTTVPVFPGEAVAPVTERIQATKSGNLHLLDPVTGVPPRPDRWDTYLGAKSALVCLIAIVFSIGLLIGWMLTSPSQTVRIFSATTSTQLTTSIGSNLATLDAQREAVIAHFEPAVVEINGPGDQGQTTGSGVIIDARGDIITNKHVIAGVSQLHVTLSNGKTEMAQIVGTSATNDLAIIRIKPFSPMTIAVLADSAHLTVGETVLALGSPLGYARTVTEGMISALNRSADETGVSGLGNMHLTGLIQTSAALNPGNSGGALINMQGELIGLPTLAAIDTETNTPANEISFAIPSNQIKQVLIQMG
jgi:S1-C subfamily serine protease